MSLSLADRRERSDRSRWKKASPHIAVALAASALLATAGTALAEGGFDSSLSGVRSGFTSRQWTDQNADGATTTTQVSGCSRSDGATFLLNVELRKRRSFASDVSYGTRNVSSCKGGAPTASWGNPGSGDFFDQFTHYDFGTVSASSVKVRY